MQSQASPGRASPGRAIPGRAIPGRAIPGHDQHPSAATLLDDVDRIRRESRQLVAAAWFPLLIGGIATLASIPAAVIIDEPNGLGIYWAFAGPAIGLASALFYATRRVLAPPRLAAAIIGVSVAIVVGALTIGSSTDDDWRVALTSIWVGAGLSVIGLLYRSALVMLVGVVQVVGALVVGAASVSHPEETMALLAGLVGCAGGLISLLVSMRTDATTLE